MIDGSPDAVAILLAALLLDAVLGDMPRLFRRAPHPVALLGSLIDALDRRLNRPHRSVADRQRRGALTLVAVAGFAGFVGWLLALAGPLVEIPAAFLLLAQRGLWLHVRDVADGLGRSLGAGRARVARIVGRDPAALDRAGVARAGIESLAENFSDAVVAPVFWFLLLGLPGLAACKAINTLDSMVGHRTPRHEAFGLASARADDAVNFVPARLSVLLLVLASAVRPGARPGAAWRTALRDASRHRSVNAGWPVAAMAGALGLALAGPRRYGGETVRDAWLGEGGRADVDIADMRRALRLFVAACAVQFALLGVAWAVMP